MKEEQQRMSNWAPNHALLKIYPQVRFFYPYFFFKIFKMKKQKNEVELCGNVIQLTRSFGESCGLWITHDLADLISSHLFQIDQTWKTPFSKRKQNSSTQTKLIKKWSTQQESRYIVLQLYFLQFSHCSKPQLHRKLFHISSLQI